MYVLSIKRIKDIFDATMNDPEWEYASYDNFSGPLSSGYPIFAGLNHAISFSTVDEAKKWFEENARYIDLSRYDKTSLAVRKLVFKTVEKIAI